MAINAPPSPNFCAAGHVTLQAADGAGVARVRISNPGKLNALSVTMWRELRALFEGLRGAARTPRVLLVCGADGHFAAGGDIAEFPQFRFDPDTLRRFHEEDVAPALRSMLDCDIPVVAQIEGSCIGGGLEIAACCDLRIAGRGSRFGIPIARLGFPLAPSEAAIVGTALGLPLLRELLLEARLLGAEEALAKGIVTRVVDDSAVAAEALAAAARIAATSPQAHKLNKRMLRQLAAGGPSAMQQHEHFAYADSAEHREGLAAFVEKRPPRF
jgi:enoyl-CoA hydratase/carnithine racemase